MTRASVRPGPLGPRPGGHSHSGRMRDSLLPVDPPSLEVIIEQIRQRLTVTVEAIGMLKNPPMVIAKQANMARELAAQTELIQPCLVEPQPSLI
jgi:hypothetical protein